MQVGTDRCVEPTILVTIGGQRFAALLDTGSSRSLLGHEAMMAAAESGSSLSDAHHVLQLAAGSSTATYSLSSSIRWQGGHIIQPFLYLPGMNRQVILGRDFLNESRISIDVNRGEWTMGRTRHTFVTVADEPEVTAAFNWVEEDLHLNLLFAAMDEDIVIIKKGDSCNVQASTIKTSRSPFAWQPPSREEQLQSVIREIHRLCMRPPEAVHGDRRTCNLQSSTSKTSRSPFTGQPPSREEQLQSVIREMRKLYMRPSEAVHGDRRSSNVETGRVDLVKPCFQERAAMSSGTTIDRPGLEAMFVDNCFQSSVCPEH
jgi:Aspartyl protease